MWPDRRQPLVEAEAHDPGCEPLEPDGGAVEDVLAVVVRAAQQPVGEEDPEERNEDRAEEQQEVLVVPQVDHHRAGRGDRADEDDQQPLREPRQQVLERHGRRIDVREGLVRFVDGEREEGEDSGASGGDRGGERLRVADAAGEHDEDP